MAGFPQKLRIGRFDELTHVAVSIFDYRNLVVLSFSVFSRTIHSRM
jgi:hypothetical protein